MIEQLTVRENNLIRKSKKELAILKFQEQTTFYEIAFCEENRDIYEQYVFIALEGSKQQFEALKRAVFFQWYADSEPTFLTFISDLKPELQSVVLEKIQELIQNKKLDSEFENMLAWYYFITDWYFNNFTSLTVLLAYLPKIRPKIATNHFGPAH